jgi:hypothetical protein
VTSTRLAANHPSFNLMKSRIVSYVVRAALCVAAAAAVSGCANLQPQANGPGDCVGPPDYCVPFFGS